MHAGISWVGAAAESLARVGKHWEEFRGRSEEPLDRKVPRSSPVQDDRDGGWAGGGVTRRECRSAERGWRGVRREAQREETLPAIVFRARGRTGTDP